MCGFADCVVYALIEQKYNLLMDIAWRSEGSREEHML